MRRTKNILTAELTASVVAALLIVVLFETGLIVPGVWYGNGEAAFIVAFVMEMITVCLIPLALYMFKIGKVRNLLTKDDGKAAGRLMAWGSLRMMMLCLPMVLNTLFYYMFGLAVSFGYMAIILFLCLFMVYPSMDRCLSETSNIRQQ